MKLWTEIVTIQEDFINRLLNTRSLTSFFWAFNFSVFCRYQKSIVAIGEKFKNQRKWCMLGLLKYQESDICDLFPVRSCFCYWFTLLTSSLQVTTTNIHLFTLSSLYSLQLNCYTIIKVVFDLGWEKKKNFILFIWNSYFYYF